MSKHTEDFLLLEEGELDYEELDDRPRRHAVVQQTPNDPRTAMVQQTTNDPRLLAVAMILECKTVLNPSNGKGCIVSPLQKLQRKKRATRLVDQHPRYDDRVLKGRHQQPRCDDVCHPTLTKKTDSCPETRHLRTGETCFPIIPLKDTFMAKLLFCLAIRKNGFTLSDGTVSASVDNDAGWKRTLTSLLLQKKLDRVFLVDSETKNQFSQISQTLTNVQAIKLDPPSDRHVQPCPYCQDKDCHRWLAGRKELGDCIRSGLYKYPCMELPASVADSNSTWNGV
ncbi:hypothetical protein CEXT_579541 [Caerostris extrusa]|uniref:Uncharacterized protein n=1 Tax=Caerostris extrusa TaxID=172846 RepID=A0AAV4V1P8_CAEEX|nr:hypothetical protein CEXT_579541 [Caerostris extrusa]